MSNQKTILISLTFMLLISFSFLATLERKQHVIKDGWFLYFDNIENDSLNFTIENYSNKNDFTWEITAENKSFLKDSLSILKEDKKSVTINEPLQKGLIKITVYHAKEKKEIYKNFE